MFTAVPVTSTTRRDSTDREDHHGHVTRMPPFPDLASPFAKECPSDVGTLKLNHRLDDRRINCRSRTRFVREPLTILPGTMLSLPRCIASRSLRAGVPLGHAFSVRLPVNWRCTGYDVVASARVLLLPRVAPGWRGHAHRRQLLPVDQSVGGGLGAPEQVCNLADGQERLVAGLIDQWPLLSTWSVHI
jgi:hypothetical protein